MEDSTVTQILDDNAKSGTSAKTNKPWSMSRVGLANGESTFIFNPIEIGDVVEATKNGEYINWAKKKVDPKHDELMKALRANYKLLTEVAKLVGVEIAEPKPKPAPKPEPKKDVVHEVKGEDFSLGDIPF